MKFSAAILLVVSLTLPVAADRRRAVTPGAPPCAETALATGFYTNDLVSDRDFVYFGDDKGGLFRISKKGGQPSRLLQLTDGSMVAGMAVDDTAVFFTTAIGDSFLSPIYSVPKTGGIPTLLASGVVSPLLLVLDNDFVYWNSLGTLSGDEYLTDGKIERMRKNGTGRETLASALSLPLAIALDGDNVIFGESGLSIGSRSFGVRSVPKNGGTVTTLVDQRPVTVVTATSTNIYAAFLGGSVSAISKATKAETVLVPSTGGFAIPVNLVVEGTDLYWFLISDSDAIYALPLAGGTPRVVRTGNFATQRFFTDGCALFYATLSDDGLTGTIRRGPR